MRAHSIKTDNASIPDKVFLRKEATKHLAHLRVLDLYAGKNVLWRQFDTARYYGVEIVPDKGANLHADCRRVVQALDLSSFNVIDCDSYGIPFEVILEIFKNPSLQKGTVIIYTAISSKMSNISRACLELFGLQGIYKKTRSLVNANGLNFFYWMLEKHGVDAVYYYQVKTSYEKHYGYFSVT